jgi:hypothetical protein
VEEQGTTIKENLEAAPSKNKYGLAYAQKPMK